MFSRLSIFKVLIIKRRNPRTTDCEAPRRLQPEARGAGSMVIRSVLSPRMRGSSGAWPGHLENISLEERPCCGRETERWRWEGEDSPKEPGVEL